MITVKQTEQFETWLDGLKDSRAKISIAKRIFRVENGLFGDSKRLTNTDGIHELRIDIGKGYRVYFLRKGSLVVFLLNGGDKGTQNRDIEKAKQIAKGIDHE